jgi:Domain of unknown function (DUF4432)
VFDTHGASECPLSEQLLQEVERMVSLWGCPWTRGELLARVGRFDQVAGVQLAEAGDGAERGVRMLRFTTGAGFGFDVLVDRGFDVGRAWLGGRPLAWWSPVGLIGPWLHDSAGIGWFRGFPGGLVSTCGLDHTLLGGTDDSAVFNYPHRRTETYGLHGRYTGLPARLAGYGTTWHGDECLLWAEGEVIQAAVFGEQLTLRRRIEADLGGTALRITDTVINTGATGCPHMLLYHCNIGFPVAAPRADFVEECYEHDMAAGADGVVSAAVVNRRAGLGVYQRYQLAAFPHHITWRQLGAGTYVVAMEPSTNRDAGRLDARARGELQHLAPGEERRYTLEIGALDGADAIEEFTASAGRLAEQVTEGAG